MYLKYLREQIGIPILGGRGRERKNNLVASGRSLLWMLRACLRRSFMYGVAA